MPGRSDGSAAGPRQGGVLRPGLARVVRLLPVRPAMRVAFLGVFFVLVTGAFLTADHPGLAVYHYALIPILLAVHWFGLAGGLTVAAVATLLFVGAAWISHSTYLSGGDLWIAGVNRAIVFFGAALLVALLLERERALARTVIAQRDDIADLESLRAALTPSAVPLRPHLQFATSYTPSDGLVAGDFFLVAEGPGGSTTVAVGDVVGHGLDAARCAAFVRAGLATFARFTRDPVELLQLANAALVEHDEDGGHFVTALCLNIGTPPTREVSWASAGHDVPWFLDTGTPLPGGRVGAPLGIGADALVLEAGRARLDPGKGLLVFTDGLVEGRARRRTGGATQLFGEERARRVVQEHCGAPPAVVLEALVSAVRTFAGGWPADDLCLVAVRSEDPTAVG